MSDGVCRAVGLQRFHDVSQNSSGTQYPVYQLSALCEPQQYRAESEVQNSLQPVQVTAKVAVFSFSIADAQAEPVNLNAFSRHALKPHTLMAHEINAGAQQSVIYAMLVDLNLMNLMWQTNWTRLSVRSCSTAFKREQKCISA